MIILHRLGHPAEPFQLNPDLIVSVESTPDTVVTLATTAKVVVAETPDEVTAATREWRVGVLAEALRQRRAEHEPAAVQALPTRILSH
jgi:flagellar protein FlbD